nr:MAG TPA: hypothetical protein [Caudoviricetes sp.]
MEVYNPTVLYELVLLTIKIVTASFLLHLLQQIIVNHI